MKAMAVANLLVWFIMAPLTVGTALAGAAAEEAPGTDARERVSERALERWKHLIAGDFESAYALLSPTFREAVPFEVYRGRFGRALEWRDARVESVTCSGVRCNAVVAVTYHYPAQGFEGTRYLQEAWIMVDGEWWRFEEI